MTPRHALIALCLALGACGPSRPDALQSPVATDGDTIRTADGQRIRLARIDAPEMPSHPCRRGRHCQPGDPYAARDALQALLDRGARCTAQGEDVYRRTLAECVTPDGKNIGDELLRQGVVGLYRRPRR